MAEFIPDHLDMFLGVVRKYMQMRGPMSQKDLAVLAEVGVSTMSRFLNNKTSELNPQIIAKITAKLAIPMHEIIEFIAEEYTQKFKRLVKFYRDDEGGGPDIEHDYAGQEKRKVERRLGGRRVFEEEDHSTAVSSAGTAVKKTEAKVSIAGSAKTTSIPFSPAQNPAESLSELLANLSPRQKAYLTDFLSLDNDSRELMVELGESLLRYFRLKNVDFK